jgi:hypothetical protein
MEQSASWEAHVYTATQEIVSILCKPKDFNIILPSTPRISKFPLYLRYPTKSLYTYLLFPMRATCPARFTLLDLIPPKMFGDEHKS